MQQSPLRVDPPSYWAPTPRTLDDVAADELVAARPRRQRRSTLQHATAVASCECVSCLRGLTVSQRVLGVLAVLETGTAVGYAAYVLATLTPDDRKEYFAAGEAVLVSVALWLFMISSAQRENTYELFAAVCCSSALCVVPLLLLLKQPEGDGFVELLEDIKTIDRGLRIAFVVAALLVGVAFIGAAILAWKHYSWNAFLAYGFEPQTKRLKRILMRFWVVWKVDILDNALCLLASWAFVFEGGRDSDWTLSDVGALVAALFSNLLCTLVLMIVVDREHKILTIIVLVFAMLQPLYVGWRLVDIIVQRLVLDSELYANVWLSVMLPTLILAVVVRVIMVVMALRIALTVYGKGLKGVNPYEKEVELPRALTAKLRRQPKLLDAVKALVHGQQLRIRLLDDTKVYGAQASPIGAGGLGAGGPVGAGGHLALVDHSQYRGLHSCFAKLSPDLATLALASIPGVAVAADLTAASTDLGLDLRIDHLLDVEVATKGARCSTIAAAPPTAAADPLALAYTQSFAAGGTACRFRLTFANGDRRRLVVLAQANDATALQRWTQGLQAVRLCRPQPGGPVSGLQALPKVVRSTMARMSLTAVATPRSADFAARAHAQPPSPQGPPPVTPRSELPRTTTSTTRL